jgi:hypothetical protein
MAEIAPPRGIRAADWRFLLGLVEDYRAVAADPMGEANEAAQAVAEECARLLLPDNATKLPLSD